MVKVELKGIAKVTAKGRSYWYAWRGGPRLRGEPGSPEFMASYNVAVESRRLPDPARFRSLVTLYRAGDFQKLSPSTKRNWSPWLDRIAEYFGDLSIRQFDRPEKIRPVIRKWRSNWSDKPRTADYALQVLSRVLSDAGDRGKVASNPCEGIKQIYGANRSEIIWTEADIARLKATCSGEIAHAVDLAAHTGLRLGDLLRLSWLHVGDNAIVITTGKGKQRREAIVQLYDDLKNSRHPEAGDHDPHQQQASALDKRWLRLFIQQGKDRCWHGRQRLPRPAWHGGDTVLCCHPSGARHRGDHGLGGGACRQDPSPVRRPERGDPSHHPPTQRKENIACKTGDKTARANVG